MYTCVRTHYLILWFVLFCGLFCVTKDIGFKIRVHVLHFKLHHSVLLKILLIRRCDQHDSVHLYYMYCTCIVNTYFCLHRPRLINMPIRHGHIFIHFYIGSLCSSYMCAILWKGTCILKIKYEFSMLLPHCCADWYCHIYLVDGCFSYSCTYRKSRLSRTGWPLGNSLGLRRIFPSNVAGCRLYLAWKGSFERCSTHITFRMCWQAASIKMLLR